MGNICRSPMAERLLRLAAWERVGDRADALLLSHSAGTGGGGEGGAVKPPATAEQVDFVVGLRPDAAARTFVFGEFGRLLSAVDPAALPPAAAVPDAAYVRGVALVEAAHAARAGRSPEPGDELDDPWGRGDSVFSRVAGEIDSVVRPLAAVLLG